MLDTLRRAASGNIAKLLLGLLIISFGMWGITDVFRGYGAGDVASVGGEKITIEGFDRMYRAEINSLSIENERRISQEEARKEGIDRLVLSKMITQSALEQQSKDLGLALTMDRVANELKSDPTFFGPDGKFSRLSFDDLLSRLGISENFFLSLRRSDELRQQITTALVSSIYVPKPIIDITNSFKNETRTIEFFNIDLTKNIKVSDPDEMKLKSYYDENKSQFMTPEFRKYSVLVASIDDLKNEASISEDEIKSNYEENKNSYDVPEKRRIQQLSFKEKNKALEAKNALTSGTKNFNEIAKELGAKESDINLGLLSKQELIDKKIAETIFKLDRDAISDAIEGQFSTVLVRVIEIEPGHLSTYEEVKDKVRDKLVTKQATNLLQERIDLVEEGRNAGKTMKEISQDLKLKLIEVPLSDQSGKSPDGTNLIDIENSERILRKIFQTAPGTETEPIELGQSGYAWIDVQNIEPPQQKAFDIAKQDVKTAFIDSEKKRLIKELAEKLLERIKNGESFAKLAEEQGTKLDQLEDVKRNLVPPGLTEEAVKIAFTLPLNGSSSAPTTDRSSRTVLKVTKITPPSALSQQDEGKLSAELGQELQNDVLLTYVQDLQDKLGVIINENEFRRAIGADVNVN